jgi:hypothetical protein
MIVERRRRGVLDPRKNSLSLFDAHRGLVPCPDWVPACAGMTMFI